VGHEVRNRHPFAAPHTDRQAVLDQPLADAIEYHPPILDETLQRTSIGVYREQRGGERETHEGEMESEVS